MKHQTFVLLFTLLFAFGWSTAQAQVVVNLTDGTVTGLETMEDLTKGSTYYVTVKGVNLNLYKVTVEGTDTSTSKAVVFPTFAIPGLGDLTTLSANIGPLTTKVLGISPSLTLTKVVRDSLAATDDLIREWNSRRSLLPNDRKLLVPVLTAALLTPDTVRERLSAFGSIHDQYNDLLRPLKQEIDAFLLNLKLRSLELRGVDTTAAAVITYAEALKQLEQLRGRVLDNQKVVLKAGKDLADYSALPSVKKVIGEFDDIAVYHKALTEKIGTLAGKYDAAFAAVNVTTMDPILEQLKVLDGNYSFTYRSIGFQYKGGDGKIKVTATPSNPALNLPSYGTTYRFPLKNKRYVGVSAAFYASGMYNQAFSTISGVDHIADGDTTDGYMIKEEDVTKNEIGAAALFTYGGKLGSCQTLGVHLAVGPAVSLSDKVRPRLFIGGGLSIGKEHMVMLNVGYITGYTERRSVVYPDDGPYKGEPGSPTVNKLTGSWAFTIGYLFKL